MAGLWRGVVLPEENEERRERRVDPALPMLNRGYMVVLEGR